MHQWPPHIQDQLRLRSGGDDWTPVAAVSLWTVDGSGHRSSTAQMQDLDDHIDIRFHRDALAASGLPVDLSGCECLVSVDSTQVRDPDPDAGPEEYWYETISAQRSVGKHLIISLPTVESIVLP